MLSNDHQKEIHNQVVPDLDLDGIETFFVKVSLG